MRTPAAALRGVQHPEAFHGHGITRGFFEGWYVKLVSADRSQRWAVIPGIFRGLAGAAGEGEGTRDEAFVQVLDFLPQNDTDAATWRPAASAPWLSVEVADGTVSKVTVQPLNGYDEDLSQGPALPHIRGIRVGDTMQTVYNYLPGGTTYDVLAAGLHSYLIATRTGPVVSFRESWDGNSVVAAITLADSNRADINFPAPDALDLSAFPAELQGTWCQREDPSACFSLIELLTDWPHAYMPDREPWPGDYQPDSHWYKICLDVEYGFGGDCSMAATMFVAYYPQGVDGPCPGAIAAGWPACEGNYSHDTSVARLVIEANHQQGDLYWDMPPMYEQ